MQITREMLFPLAFYKKSPFHGSKGEKNYRIEKYSEEEQDFFRLYIWQGPYCFDATKEEKEISIYPFTEEGMEEIIGKLNSL